MTQIAYSVSQVLKLAGIGRTKLYEAIGSGHLRARKLGTRTIILATDLQEWLEGLPELPARVSTSKQTEL